MQPGNTIQPEQSTVMPRVETKQQETVAQPKTDARHGSVSWRASEYVEHEKQPGWYLLLGVGTAVVSTVSYLLIHDILSTIVIVISAILFGVVAARKPRTLDFVIDHSGITIGETHHMYETFKTFCVVDDGAMRSILLLPLKRFMPPLSLYYPPEEESAVVETLGQYIPYQEASGGSFDRLMSRIRF